MQFVQLVLIIDINRLLRTESGIADVKLKHDKSRFHETNSCIVFHAHSTYLHTYLLQ